MRRWPAIRTDKTAPQGRYLAVLFKAAMGMIALSLVFALAVIVVSLFIGFLPRSVMLADNLFGFGVLMLLSPVLSVPSLLAGLPIAWLALRAGLAGWFMAILGGWIAGTVSFLVLEDFIWDNEMISLGLAIGGLFGGLFWLSGRIMTPEVFFGPKGYGDFD